MRTISAHLDLEIANITRTFEALRSDKMREAAELIAAAPRVWVIGMGGDEEGFARYARLLFSRLRHSVMILGINQGSWAEDLAMTGPKDVLLLITLPPHRALLKQILGYAATSRLNIVTITDRGSVSEAQRYARVVLPCHVDSFALGGASYTAVSSAIRLLALTYASLAGKSAQQRLEIVAGIHDELDDID